MPDLSVFPILRIDQLRLCDTATLIHAEQVLSLSYDGKDHFTTELEPITRYCIKLIDAIQNEIALRRIGELITNSQNDDEEQSNQIPDLSSPENLYRSTTVKHEIYPHPQQVDLMPLHPKEITQTVASSKTLVGAPMKFTGVPKGLRSRAQAIFRKMKLKRISDSTNATNDKQNRGISRNFRKPILTRFTAAKYKIQQSSAQSFSRTAPYLRDKIDDNRGNQSDPKGYTESASTFVSNEVPECVEREESHGSSLESSHLSHDHDIVINTDLSSCDLEGNLHSSSCHDNGDRKLVSEAIEYVLVDNTNPKSYIQGISLSDTQIETELSGQSVEHDCKTDNVDVLRILQCNTQHREDMEGTNNITVSPDSSWIPAEDIVPNTDDKCCHTTYETTKECCVQTTLREPWDDDKRHENDDALDELDLREAGAAQDETETPTTDVSCILSSSKQASKGYHTPRHQPSCTGMFHTLFPTFDCIFTFYKEQGKGQLKKRNLGNKMDTREICEALSFHASIKDIQDVSPINPDPPLSPSFKDPTLRWYQVQSQREELNSLISDALEDLEAVGHWRRMESSTTTTQVDAPTWNLLWTWGVPKFKFHHLLMNQKVNRFQGTKSLTRKDLLKKKLISWNGCDLMPATFNLPSEYTAFVSAFQSVQKKLGMNPHDPNTITPPPPSHHSNVWILKPAGMSRGRGIFLMDDIGNVCYSKPFVAQKYITNPLLYHGYKFDLRLYVLVTSFHPLEAFLYEEGLARFSLAPFSCSHDSLGDPRIHLTNSSIQKNFLNEMSRSHPVCLAGKDGGGNKVRWTWLWNKLKNEKVDASSLLWTRIQESCLKVLLSVNSEMDFQPNSFEIFGFDILIDDELKTWVIEVNGSPSMSRDYPLDSEVKEGLIKDTVALVDPSPIDRLALSEICQERLRQLSGRAMDRGEYYCKSKLELDLQRIFPQGPPRPYGGTPKLMGKFQRLYPKS